MLGGAGGYDQTCGGRGQFYWGMAIGVVRFGLIRFWGGERGEQGKGEGRERRHVCAHIVLTELRLAATTNDEIYNTEQSQLRPTQEAHCGVTVRVGWIERSLGRGGRGPSDTTDAATT